MSPDQRYLPLLRLKQTAKLSPPTKPHGEGRRFHKPSPARQDERLTPQLKRLHDAVESRRLALRDELAGVEPEMALVLETVGTVDEFVRAVRKIEGFEWLGELDAEIEPNEDFYDAKDRERRLRGSIYLVMTDQQALRSLLTLWNRWKKDPGTAFGHGWQRWRHLFAQLHVIRPWGPEDRLRETGLLEVWRERLAAGDERLRTEIELWFRNGPYRQQSAVKTVEHRIEQAGGQILAQAIVGEIAYHGILAELPAAAAQSMLELGDVELVRCDDVMFFRPAGQMGAPPAAGEEPGPEAPAPAPPAAERPPPTIAILDGLPVEHHRHLDGRLVVDDPDGWATEIPANARHHGTAMASLTLHGDLGNQEPALERPVYVRPVLKPSWDSSETIPDGTLTIDLIHRAVRRLFDGEGGQRGTAREVQVLNFSIGDRHRPFDSMVSPLARLLDWLSWKYDLLVVVSAGNHPETLELGQSIAQLQPTELQAVFWQAVRKRAHLHRLLSPAEGINLLTVGAEHRDACTSFDPGPRLDPASVSNDETVPSPITAWGYGPARALKPEILLPGGRQLYREEPGNRLAVAHAKARKPGQQVAAAGDPPDLGRTLFTVGTSNAAALASRAAGQLFDRLPQLIDGFEAPLRRHYVAPLLKALLVHGAAWGNSGELCARLLGAEDRVKLGRYLGFGFADVGRVLGCTDQRVTLIAWGSLTKLQSDVYTVPLPFALSGVGGMRRLVTTLAWLTPINPRDRRYRQADLWVSLGMGDHSPKHKLGVARCDADYNAAMRGTVHHEVWEGDKAAVFDDTDQLSLRVNCREHASGLGDYVSYGLAVTLEVAPELGLPIYEEVRAKIAPQVRVGV